MMLTRSSDPLDHSIHPVHRTVNKMAQSLSWVSGFKAALRGLEKSGHHARHPWGRTVRYVTEPCQTLHPNLSLDRSLALSASISRSRAGAWVCSDVSNRRAEAETSATARSKASALACDGLLKPESLRTNCSAEAWISSSLAGGSKLNSVLMLRHMVWLLCRSPHTEDDSRI